MKNFQPARLFTAFVLAAIRFYQAALRPLMPWGCKYYPSCSAYAIEAIESKGVKRGLALAAHRLLRCGPGSFGGYDPVPDADEPERMTREPMYEAKITLREPRC